MVAATMKRKTKNLLNLIKVLAIAGAVGFLAKTVIELDSAHDAVGVLRSDLKVEVGAMKEHRHAKEIEEKIGEEQGRIVLGVALLSFLALLPWARSSLS